ncbi:winged helix-turn-helix domain-containing protein [Companilactobacillus sp.]|jgi:hypothetical protein|uniref:winged helix-turn-helix domain-containing protein n=1 Tax=Companilactobacillus sp. TaxID=2767905 RepID=UPI0025BC7E8E|nr:winged helix-turn-helix domain-containing protein [Companilactobacillus sp.]MCH4009400.1 winged helix-turn-helix domain-containing protein [Companilactobacillus sp.]MCH4050421.1 winged helix-turn-helix domain-containing protein [Companilactobacillus sp.]MCH4077342.1 winged helix-turn-helix domain-containing protein [Companilactobacillus sp.]MCH4125918.1 winged helix-turn-helix domain-containing protein [Companilactobacillus sp.]MCI1311627.1 winged helix-turn-helix domain-containing protein 
MTEETKSLAQIIFEFTGSKANTSDIVSKTNLSKSTVSDALKRPIGRTSFEVATKILFANSVSVDKVVSHITDEKIDPSKVELNFVNQTNTPELSIMGIKFSNKENYWKARDGIMNNIYEGMYPTKEDVENSYRILEEHVPVENVVDDIIKKHQSKK